MINVHSVSLIKNREQFTAGQVYPASCAKTLSEFRQQAILPEVDGIAARVLTALQNRIGHSSLAIAHLASDLNLSKRTLQRRLQQEDINFAQLRDKLRFNHAISYLVEQKN
jgi:AraC-like DNA-binding protein